MIIGFDVETHTTNPWSPHFVLLSAAWDSQYGNNTFLIGHPDFNEQDERSLDLFFQHVLPLSDLTFIGHRIGFDRVAWLSVYPGSLNNVKFFDTSIAQILIDETIPRNSLEKLAEMYLDEEEKIKVDVKNLIFQPRAKVLEYNLQDARLSRLLYKPLKERLEEQGLTTLFNFLMKLQDVLVHMQIRGVRLDKEWTERELEKLSRDVEETDSKIFKIVGYEFNLNSGKQLGKALYDVLGFPVIARTEKTKIPATSVPVLKQLRREYQDDTGILDLLIGRSKKVKIKNSFLSPYLEKHLGIDGRIHGSYHIARGAVFGSKSLGTVTGRLSSSDPNLTQIPRGPEVKGCFIPDPGHLFCSVDYSQVELRVASWLSNDRVMQERIRDGLDIHTLQLAKDLQLSYEEACEYAKTPEGKETRVAIKTKNFTRLYGGSEYTVHKRLLNDLEIDIPIEQERRDQKLWFQEYGGLRRYIDMVHFLIDQQEEVTNELGMKRRLHKSKKDKRRQGLNFLIQSFASQLTLASMLLLHANGYDLLLSVHDSILFQYPEYQNEEAITNEVIHVMTDQVKNYLATEFEVRRLDELYLKVDMDMGLERWQ